jgi:dolichol-phosphate mannosyltransferase
MIYIILPTYNESKNIVPLLCMLQDVLTNIPYRCIMVDDNSPDNSAEIDRNLNIPNVIILTRPCKMGLGSAYQLGIKECIYKYTIIMDTDLQHDPYAISGMLEAIKDCDLVTGTRNALDIF